jgi:hypothetical protein
VEEEVADEEMEGEQRHQQRRETAEAKRARRRRVRRAFLGSHREAITCLDEVGRELREGGSGNCFLTLHLL